MRRKVRRRRSGDLQRLRRTTAARVMGDPSTWTDAEVEARNAALAAALGQTDDRSAIAAWARKTSRRVDAAIYPASCHRDRKRHARGLCSSCYAATRRAERREEDPR